MPSTHDLPETAESHPFHKAKKDKFPASACKRLIRVESESN